MNPLNLSIDSPSNPRVVSLLKATDVLFFEGQKVVTEILHQKGANIEVLLVLKDCLSPLPASLPSQIREIWQVSSRVMSKLTELKTIPSLAAVLKPQAKKLNFQSIHAVLAVVDVQDPGNLGTLFRSAVAFGINGIAMIGDSVHITNRKLIRAAQNALLQMPYQYFKTLDDLLVKCKKSRLNIYLSTAGSEKGVISPDSMLTPCVVVLGNEGQGLKKDYLNLYPCVKIPQLDKIESLNVAVSGSILMHELRKKWSYE